MQHEVKGGTTPILEITLSPGDEVVAESGELAWLRGPVQLATSMGAGQQKSGFLGAAKRAIGGGTFFMTSYTIEQGTGSVVFAAKAPGEIKPIQVGGGQEYVVHRHGFVCGEPGVELNVYMQKRIGAGVFGGAGFILQRLSGQGLAFVEMTGDVVEIELTAGDELRVHPGHVALFDASINLELTTVPGIKNKIFGGDGLFLARLTGQGKVWLQSISMAALAAAIQPYLEPEHNSGDAATIGGAAGVLGSLLKS
jgi:uncharacterized protein (TIGR00266 family)